MSLKWSRINNVAQPDSDCAVEPLVTSDAIAQSETTIPLEPERFRQAYNKAIAYLARREYSAKELQQRLRQKEFPFALIDSVLEKLIEDGYQSDERFTEMYIRSRVNAGDGPFKIKMKLREKGICESLTLAVLDTQTIDWLEQVKEVKEKRFGKICDSPAELAKQIRYLKNKGYYQEDIQAVVGLN